MKRNLFKLLLGLGVASMISGCSTGMPDFIFSENSSSSHTSSNTTSTSTSSSTSSSSSSTTSSSSSSSSTSSSSSSINSEMTSLTISQFINRADENTYYILEGTISNITDDRYGNFDLVDSTGSIFVYGLLSSKNSTNKKEFSSMGLKEGDKIRLAGQYLNYYNTKHEVVNAYLIEKLSSSSSDDGGNTGASSYQFTDFTSSEKSLMNSYFGTTLPFMPTNEYYFEDTFNEDGTVWYCTIGNTSSDFNSYKSKLNSKFTSDGTDVDEFGDTWYYYSYNDYYIDLCFYNYEGVNYLELFFYDPYFEGGDDSGDSGSSNDQGILYTNEGKGLPSGNNGVYNVNFKDAVRADVVNETGLYLDGCPTTGDVDVLVIPLEFSDCTAESKGYSISAIDNAFNVGNDLLYPSVKDYYYESSYHKLNLNFDILDDWYRAENPSSTYLEMDENDMPVDIIINDVLESLSPTMDLTKYDSDNNGTIDAIVVISTLDIEESNDANVMRWAYRYWNMYSEDGDNYVEHDNVYANDYLYACYQFLYETEFGYDGNKPNNTYTFIHEFGHVLGADDYYDFSYETDGPLDGYDVMDAAYGDHNPFTKFIFGWIENTRLVSTNDTVTLTLNEFSSTGDTIILGNNFDPELGAFQEYYILALYNSDNYFGENGIVMYHVDGSLMEYNGYEEQYYIYNTNASTGEYYTGDYLIEFIYNNDNYLFTQGEGINGEINDNFGNPLQFSFVVDSLNSEQATITFNKN